MRGSLSGRVALVTGSARRVGKAIALELAEAGAHILLHYHSSGAAEVRDATGDIKSLGVDAFAVQADLSEAAGVDALFAGLEAHFGRLDIAVNSAAVFSTARYARRVAGGLGFDHGGQPAGAVLDHAAGGGADESESDPWRGHHQHRRCRHDGSLGEVSTSWHQQGGLVDADSNERVGTGACHPRQRYRRGTRAEDGSTGSERRGLGAGWRTGCPCSVLAARQIWRERWSTCARKITSRARCCMSTAASI